MSGGSFDYACYRVDQFADELGLRLDEFDKKDEWGYQPNKFEPATLAKLREIEALARHTAKLMKEAEWLYSGDTSDDSFMMRVTEIESSNASFSREPERSGGESAGSDSYGGTDD